MVEVAAEWSLSGRIILNVGQSQTWWFSWWMFDEARVVKFDTTPDRVLGSSSSYFAVQITEVWAERWPGAGGNVLYKVTFRNRGNEPVVFRPRIAVIPAARWGGGLSA